MEINIRLQKTRHSSTVDDLNLKLKADYAEVGEGFGSKTFSTILKNDAVNRDSLTLLLSNLTEFFTENFPEKHRDEITKILTGQKP